MQTEIEEEREGEKRADLLREDSLLFASNTFCSFCDEDLFLVTYKAALEACSCSLVSRCTDGSGQGGAETWLSFPGCISSALVCCCVGSV